MSKTKKKSKFCNECFAELMRSGVCPECTVEEVFREQKTKPRGKWEPNIKHNEKWEKVKSDYKPYKDGV